MTANPEEAGTAPLSAPEPTDRETVEDWTVEVIAVLIDLVALEMDVDGVATLTKLEASL